MGIGQLLCGQATQQNQVRENGENRGGHERWSCCGEVRPMGGLRELIPSEVGLLIDTSNLHKERLGTPG